MFQSTWSEAPSVYKVSTVVSPSGGTFSILNGLPVPSGSPDVDYAFYIQTTNPPALYFWDSVRWTQLPTHSGGGATPTPPGEI